MRRYSHVKLVSVSKQMRTNLLLECIFSNLFTLQASFFAHHTGVYQLYDFGGESSDKTEPGVGKKLI